MKNPQEVIPHIEEALEFLSRPLSADDIESGWTENARQNWLRGLQSLKEDILRSPTGDYSRINTAKALGTDGIVKGELGERIARVGNLLMKTAGGLHKS